MNGGISSGRRFQGVPRLVMQNRDKQKRRIKKHQQITIFGGNRHKKYAGKLNEQGCQNHPVGHVMRAGIFFRSHGQQDKTEKRRPEKKAPGVGEIKSLQKKL